MMVHTVRLANDLARNHLAACGKASYPFVLLLFNSILKSALMLYFRLTAFVVKSFSRAKSYIYIDPKSLEKSIKFMMSRQLEDGSFTESGSVSSYLQVRRFKISACSLHTLTLHSAY